MLHIRSISIILGHNARQEGYRAIDVVGQYYVQLYCANRYEKRNLSNTVEISRAKNQKILSARLVCFIIVAAATAKVNYGNRGMKIIVCRLMQIPCIDIKEQFIFLRLSSRDELSSFSFQRDKYYLFYHISQ